MSKTTQKTKEMLINTVEGQECRIAIVSDEGLEELYIERSAAASHVGNIYKARVTNVEPGIQAAFVDAGLGKNGFLHISDVNPSYFPKGKQAPEKVGHKRPHYVRPPIQECLKRGQEVVVQMTKEGIGTKGPTMTTYLSIPGRLLVMMPGMTKLGVSRKVEDDEARARARAALSELKLPGDVGFIVRTAGVDRSKRDLQRDLNYLLRLWKAVKKQIKSARAPVELYRESDLVTRTIRDVYNSEIRRIVCDNPADARRIREFLAVAVPRTAHTIEVYTGSNGLFYDTGVEDEIERIHSRRIELPSGGSLIFDQAEALVAIDVNSGRYRQHADAETTALRINIEAAREIVRQLRLRDLGGVIVIDFIDMREEKNRRRLEKTLKDALKNDRAKTKVLRTSAFGMIEMTRQRLGPSLKQSVFDRCTHCDGTGVVKSVESLALHVIRCIQRACAHEHVAHVEAAVPPEVAHFLNNRQRRQLVRLEETTGRSIVIRADHDLAAGTARVRCTNARGSEVAWETPLRPNTARQPLQTVPIDELPEEDRTAPETPPPATPDAAEAETAPPGQAPAGQPEPARAKKSRRGRRGGRKRRKRSETPETASDEKAQPEGPDAGETPKQPAGPEPAEPRPDQPRNKTRRRRKRPAPPAANGAAESPAEVSSEPETPEGKKQAVKTRRRRKKAADPQDAGDATPPGESAEPETGTTGTAPKAAKKRKRRTRKKAAAGRAEQAEQGGQANAADRQDPAE